MHHGILISVRGDTAEDAKCNAVNIMAATLCCEHCNHSVNGINWDYYTFVSEVEDNWVKQNKSCHGAESVEELAEIYRDEVLYKAKTETLRRLKEEYENLFDNNGEFNPHTMLDFYNFWFDRHF